MSGLWLCRARARRGSPGPPGDRRLYEPPGQHCTLGDRVADDYEGEPVGERTAITYRQLLDEVVRAANGLRALGVGKGTPVGIYMGMGIGLPVAMLACARLGAPHTVVFGGSSAKVLADRLNDMRCEVLLTQDESYRRGTIVPLKRNADEALEFCPGLTKVVVGQRTRGDVPMTPGRDLTWNELVEGQPTDPASCPCEPMDSEDLLYLLYTSGTTAKPKGIARRSPRATSSAWRRRTAPSST